VTHQPAFDFCLSGKGCVYGLVGLGLGWARLEYFGETGFGETKFGAREDSAWGDQIAAKPSGISGKEICAWA